MDVKPRLLFSLGRHSKQAGDECDLTHDVPSFHPLHLSLPDHIPDLISLQGSPRALHRKEAQSRFDASFDEAVILFDDVVEILDLPQFTGVGNGSLCFQLTDGLGIGRICIDRDHTRGGAMRRSERFREAGFGCFGIAGGTEPKFQGVALRIHGAIDRGVINVQTPLPHLSSRSRELSEYRTYQRTQSKMMSAS
jgi:hypothetical protein